MNLEIERQSTGDLSDVLDAPPNMIAEIIDLQRRPCCVCRLRARREDRSSSMVTAQAGGSWTSPNCI
jgi:hypothetical protein